MDESVVVRDEPLIAQNTRFAARHLDHFCRQRFEIIKPARLYGENQMPGNLIWQFQLSVAVIYLVVSGVEAQPMTREQLIGRFQPCSAAIRFNYARMAG